MARPREFDEEKALAQVMRVFWARGYQASTFDDLTRAADVRKQSLYGAFGDKRALFLKSLGLYREQLIGRARELVRGAGSPLEGIEELLRFAALAPTKDSPAGCLMANTALELGGSDSEIAAEVKKTFRGLEEILSAAAKHGQERGEISTRFDSSAIGQSLTNTINGLRVLQNTGASRHHVNQVVELALAAIAA